MKKNCSIEGKAVAIAMRSKFQYSRCRENLKELTVLVSPTASVCVLVNMSLFISVTVCEWLRHFFAEYFLLTTLNHINIKSLRCFFFGGGRMGSGRRTENQSAICVEPDALYSRELRSLLSSSLR